MDHLNHHEFVSFRYSSIGAPPSTIVYTVGTRFDFGFTQQLFLPSFKLGSTEQNFPQMKRLYHVPIFFLSD